MFARRGEEVATCCRFQVRVVPCARRSCQPRGEDKSERGRGTQQRTSDQKLQQRQRRTTRRTRQPQRASLIDRTQRALQRRTRKLLPPVPDFGEVLAFAAFEEVEGWAVRADDGGIVGDSGGPGLREYSRQSPPEERGSERRTWITNARHSFAGDMFSGTRPAASHAWRNMSWSTSGHWGWRMSKKVRTRSAKPHESVEALAVGRGDAQTHARRVLG